MESIKDCKVVIIGGDHYNTYGVVRSLGEEGIKSDVLILDCKSGDSFVLRSRYIERGHGCVSKAEAVAYLTNNYDSNSKIVVICCSDEAEELIIKHYELLSKQFILPVCKDYKETLRLMNKNAITELAQQHGLLTPKTWMVFNRKLPIKIDYPCITKPLTSTSGHKSDIVVCENEIELLDVVEDKNRCPNFIIQQYIEFEKEISILGAVLSNGDVLFSGCIDKLRTCMIGTTSFGKMVDKTLLGGIVSRLEMMIKCTGYRGLFSAEFIVKDGKHYFLEVNFRNDGNTYVATASGINLPLLYVKSVLGAEKEQAESKSSFPCFFMLEIEDFLTLKHNRVSLSQWKKELKTSKTCLVYNRQDIKPFNKKIEKTILSIIRRAWHKLVIA